MRVINRRILQDLWEQQPGARLSLQAWFHLTRRADWRSPDDLQAVFPCSSFLTADWVIFDFQAIHCRLVAQVLYRFGLVVLRSGSTSTAGASAERTG